MLEDTEVLQQDVQNGIFLFQEKFIKPTVFSVLFLSSQGIFSSYLISVSFNSEPS